MVKRAKAGIRVSNWVDHGGVENLFTWLYWRSLAHAKIFSNDIWRRPCMDSTLVPLLEKRQFILFLFTLCVDIVSEGDL